MSELERNISLIADRTGLLPSVVRVCLEAATPYIRAQALEDAAATLTKPGTLWWGDKGVTVAEPPALPTMTLEEWFIAQAESERATN